MNYKSLEPVFLCSQTFFLDLPFIIDTKTEQFLQLEVAAAGGRSVAVVVAGIEVELGGEVAVEHEVEGVLPVDAHPLVAGQVVETGVERDLRSDVPRQGRS